jgi:hypothetical protein
VDTAAGAGVEELEAESLDDLSDFSLEDFSPDPLSEDDLSDFSDEDDLLPDESGDDFFA